MNSNQKVAIVTGSSSGIGKEVSLVFARNGFTTYATMRNIQNSSPLKAIQESENLELHCIQLNVTDDNSVLKAIQTISHEHGRADILVNNAAYALTGAFEDLSMAEIKSQYETNVFGLIRTTQAVLPLMRKQNSGTYHKYKFRCRKIRFSYRLCLCEYKICCRRIKRSYMIRT